MSNPKVLIKWNKTQYDNIEIPINGHGKDIKDIIEKLTGVPVSRQKVMGKGLWKGLLEDQVLISSMVMNKDSNKNIVTVMGSTVESTASVDSAVAASSKTVFVEDKASSKGSGSVTSRTALLPPGLNNLGNTCYLNSNIQPIRMIPELVSALDTFDIIPANSTLQDQTVVHLRSTLKTMEKSQGSGVPVTPLLFVSSFRDSFPQFAEQQQQTGAYLQQDSDEFFNTLFGLLSDRLSVRNAGAKLWLESFLSSYPSKSFSISNISNTIDALFSIEMESTLKCVEEPSEPLVKSNEIMRRLQCPITEKVDFLDAGLMIGMEGEVEKNSEILGRTCLWNQTRRISRLPKYIVIQMTRFFWKLTPNSQDHRGVNCKILRPVTFPLVLDMFKFCSDEVQSVLKVPRSAKADAMLAKGKKEAVAVSATSASASSASTESESMEIDISSSSSEPRATGIGLPPSFDGNYELFAVVTHKGRSANSGHYMSWIKQPAPSTKWVVFDDDHPSECSAEDVLALSGGGDHHMAYQLFYRAKLDD